MWGYTPPTLPTLPNLHPQDDSGSHTPHRTPDSTRPLFQRSEYTQYQVLVGYFGGCNLIGCFLDTITNCINPANQYGTELTHYIFMNYSSPRGLKLWPPGMLKTVNPLYSLYYWNSARPALLTGADTVQLEYSPAQGEGGGRRHCPVSEAHWRDMNSEGTCCSTQWCNDYIIFIYWCITSSLITYWRNSASCCLLQCDQ